MKNLVITIGVIFLSVGVYASDDTKNEFLKKAEERLAEFCSQGHGFQPGWPDLLEAIDILAIEAKISSCALREKLKLTANHNLYINGFRSVNGGNEFTYDLVDFSGAKPVAQKCVATSTIKYESMSRRKEEFEDIKCSIINN